MCRNDCGNWYTKSKTNGSTLITARAKHMEITNWKNRANQWRVTFDESGINNNV